MIGHEQVDQPAKILEKGTFSSLHRDELKPAVRIYADNLRDQITGGFSKMGITSMEDIETKGISGEIPLEELKRINDLISRLTAIVQTGKIPESDVEALETIFSEELITSVKDWIDLKNSISPDEKDLFETKEKEFSFLNNKIGSFAEIPYFFFETDSDYPQKVLEEIINLLPPQHKQDSGLMLSAILNKIDGSGNITRLNRIIDLKNLPPVNYLGFKMGKGELTIKGRAGDYVGAQMQNCTINAETVNDVAGFKMKNGKLNVINAGENLGEEMEDGEITAFECQGYGGVKMHGGKLKITKTGDYLGFSMTGGEIEAEEAKWMAGQNMRDGIIHIKKAEDFLGESMNGGTINAQEAGDSVGFKMRNGIINIDKAGRGLGSIMTGGTIKVRIAGDDMGLQMKNGEIIAGKSGENTGAEMKGGVITVVETGDYLGLEMENGKIYAKKAGKSVGKYAKGGEIYIDEAMESFGEIDGGALYFKGKEIDYEDVGDYQSYHTGIREEEDEYDEDEEY